MVATSLSFSILQRFPAVTLCNMSPFKASLVAENAELASILGVAASSKRRKREVRRTASSTAAASAEQQNERSKHSVDMKLYEAEAADVIRQEAEAADVIRQEERSAAEVEKSGWESGEEILLDSFVPRRPSRNKRYITTGKLHSTTVYAVRVNVPFSQHVAVAGMSVTFG